MPGRPSGEASGCEAVVAAPDHEAGGEVSVPLSGHSSPLCLSWIGVACAVRTEDDAQPIDHKSLSATVNHNIYYILDQVFTRSGPKRSHPPGATYLPDPKRKRKSPPCGSMASRGVCIGQGVVQKTQFIGDAFQRGHGAPIGNDAALVGGGNAALLSPSAVCQVQADIVIGGAWGPTSKQQGVRTL